MVGTLDGNSFQTTYGAVTSKGIVTFFADGGKRDNHVLKHSAYVAPGGSGGTYGFVRFKYVTMIPCDQVRGVLINSERDSEL